MTWPIKNIGYPPLVYNPQYNIFISQLLGGHWYLPTAQTYNGVTYPAGTEFNSIFGFKGHNGLDIACPTGTNVYSALDGWIIEQTKKPTGYGNRLSILSRIGGVNLLLLYGHCEEFEVKENGQVLELDWNFNDRTHPVKEGDLVGYADSSGFATGSHLHFGAYIYDDNGNKLNSNNGYGGAIDPLPLLRGAMTNVKLVKNGSEWGFYLPATDEAEMIGKALNFGYELPKINDGKNVDWSQVKPDLTI